MFKQRRYFFQIISICSLIIVVSCKSSFVSRPFVNGDIPSKPNYHNEESWAVLPSKYSEKLKTLSIDSINKLEADVF